MYSGKMPIPSQRWKLMRAAGSISLTAYVSPLLTYPEVMRMYNEVIYLRSYTETTDEYGITNRTVNDREVFAQLRSIGQSEFYQAQADGLKPTLKFVLADYLDYQDEKEVVHDGKTYNVLRTYRDHNKIEITVYGVDDE